jgi:hypothetical protein
MFNFQDNRYGPGLQRRTYILDPNKCYNLTIQQSDEYAYFTYGGFYDDVTGVYVPIQYVGTTLSGVPGSDLGATGWYDYVQDYPNGLYHNDSKYRLKIKRDVPPGTEITMVVFDGQQTISYHTRIETPTFAIENITNEDTLLHYYSRDIEFILNFQQSCQLDGYGGAYPVGIKFNVEIVQGQEYGNLYYPGTVADPEQSGTSITNLDDEYGIGIANYTIKYKADGVQPDSLNPGIVTIRCSSNDLDIAPVEVSFPVKYNTDPPEEGGVILVDFNKESFSPGDTATTNCKWLTAYNELLDFPAEQSFNVVITGGSEFGMLLDPNTGTIADNLQGVSNGFKVITATSIPYDSVVIRLKVNTNVEVNNSSRMITNQNPKSEIKENNIADLDDDTQTITPDFFIIIPGQDIEGFGDVVVRNIECWTLADLCIEEPQPPTISCSTYSNGTFGIDVCILRKPNRIQAGGFARIPGKHAMNPVSLSPCFNTNLKYWRFQIHNIQLNAILDFCTSGFNNFNIIDNLTQIDMNKICDALIDLDDHSPYPLEVKPNHYLFKEVLATHEQKHKSVYEFYCNLNYEEMIAKIRAYKPTCLEIDNLIIAAAEGLNTITPIITMQLSENISTWKWDTGNDESDPDKEQKEVDDEEATHYSSEVQYSILNLKNELNNLYFNNYGEWPTCF